MGLLTRRRAIAETPDSTIDVPRVPSFVTREATRPASTNLAVVPDSVWPWLGTNRRMALSIPTVAMCRDLIVGAVVQMAVYRYRGTDRVDSGALLTQPDPDTTWAHTIAETVEDLIYEGRAYWLVLATDGIATQRNPRGLPVRARWIPYRDVQPVTTEDVGAYSRLQGYRIAGVDGLVAVEHVIRFDSPLRGVLHKGWRALGDALRIEAAASRMADIEIPAGVLTAEGVDLTDTEADALIERFETARRSRTVAYLQGVGYERTQLTAEDLQLVQARAHVATEMARLHNLPVAMAQASPSGGGTTMLYANLGSQLALMVTQAVAPHLMAIEQTLSLPSVTPQGQAVAFDVGSFLRSDPAALQAYVLGLLEANAITAEEARAMLGIGPAPANLQPGTV